MLMLQDPTALLVWGVVIHLVADWLLQNEWMASRKTALTEPAAWVHGGIHTLLLLLVLTWPLAILAGVTHVLIDTRKPIEWWIRVVKRVPQGSSMSQLVEVGVDQVFHVTVLALIVFLFYG